MSFFTSMKRQKDQQNRQPDESQQISDLCIANLWMPDDRSRLNWNLSRVNPNGGEPYRTFLPVHLLDVVQAEASLAYVFSNAPQVSRGSQMMLSELSKLLKGVVEVMQSRAGTADEANGKAQGAILSFPSHQ